MFGALIEFFLFDDLEHGKTRGAGQRRSGEGAAQAADDDHVARMRVHGLHRAPGRLDELIAEIAMGRSIVEG